MARVKRFLIVVFLILAVPVPRAVAGETVLADPPPSLDNPRRIVLSLTSKDPAVVNRILSNSVNIQKFYEMDNVELAIVAYGPGIRAVLRTGSPVSARIQSLMEYGIEIVACGNTLDAIQRPVGDLIEGVGHVKAGIPEIVERQLRGWIHVKP